MTGILMWKYSRGEMGRVTSDNQTDGVRIAMLLQNGYNARGRCQSHATGFGDLGEVALIDITLES